MIMSMGSYALHIDVDGIIMSRKDFNIPEKTFIVCEFNAHVEIDRMYSKHNRDIAAVEHFLKKASNERFRERIQMSILKLRKMKSSKYGYGYGYGYNSYYGYDKYSDYDSDYGN